MSSSNVAPPVVCNLEIGQRHRQQLAWSDLAEHATGRVPIHGGVQSTFPLALAEQIEELAAREISCCGSWLSIDHERLASEFRLQLTTTNPEGIDLIRSLSGL